MNFDKEDKRTIIVPMCKWVPFYFHKYILNKTLQKIYWNNSISIFTPINRKFWDNIKNFLNYLFII
jgi:hypothetical protein